MSVQTAPDDFADSDLLVHVRTIVRQWRTVGVVAFVIVAVSIGVSYTIRPVYRADVLLASATVEGGGSRLDGILGQARGLASLAGVKLGAAEGTPVDESIEILRSRSLTQRFISERNLLPVLFADHASGAKEQPPSMWKAYKRFNNLRKISKDVETGFFKLGIEWHDPQVAADWANALVRTLNEYVRQRAIDEANRSIQYLQEQLDRTAVVDRRGMLMGLMEAETRKIMLAKARDEYAVRVLDAAVAPEDKVRPRRAIIAIAAAFFGVVLGALVALGRDARRRSRSEGKADS